MIKNNIIILGTYNGSNVFFDSASNTLYKSKIQKEGKMNSFLAFFMLMFLPLIRWANTYLYIKSLFLNLTILIISIVIMLIFSKKIKYEKFKALELEEVQLRDFEMKDFLLKEKKNAKVAIKTIIILLIIVIGTGILYLLTSSFIFLFISAGLSFPYFLFNDTSPFIRYKIINNLLNCE